MARRERFFAGTLASIVGCCGLLLFTSAALGATHTPAPLSADHSPVDINSTYGSGDFGQWGVDQFGLPVYRYSDDEATDPNAKQPELAGGTQAQHQVGNDHIKGMAFNDGYTEFWSQDRLSQWANLYQPSNQPLRRRLRIPERRRQGRQHAVRSTTGRRGLRARRSASATTASRSPVDGVRACAEHTRTRRSATTRCCSTTSRSPTPARRRRTASWFEYWDVNPYDQTLGVQQNSGLIEPDLERGQPHAVGGAVRQRPARHRRRCASSPPRCKGPVADYDTSVSSLLRVGQPRGARRGRRPNKLSDTIAAPNPPGQSGNTLFALRAPVTLAPGQSVTLRYVYGMAHPSQIPGLVAKYRAAPDPSRASERAWAAYLPKAELRRRPTRGSRASWSGTPTCCARRPSTRSVRLAHDHPGRLLPVLRRLQPRLPQLAHYMLPMVYSDPELAREILEYAVQFQPPGRRGRSDPVREGPLCERVDLGTSDDLDFWLLHAAAEYGLGDARHAFFNQQCPYYDTQATTRRRSGST